MIRRAMVLAAGRGQRLAPLTDTVPKPLASVAGRPLLDHVLAFLRGGGITDVVVNLHHLGQAIVDHVGDGRRFGLRVCYSWEDPILDTGGGIKRAEPLLAGEPFVVVNGDSLLDLALADVVAAHTARQALATMVLRADPHAAEYGIVEVDGEDRVRRILGMPGETPPGPLRPFMFAGVHVFEPDIFRFMDGDRPFSVTRVTYPRLLAAGARVYGFVTAVRWITIDTAEALRRADLTLREAPFQLFPRAGAAR